MSANRILFMLFFLFILLLIVGCNQQKPEEKILKHVEETVVLEKPFEEEQGKINELELKDQHLYEEIIKLDADDSDKIVELSEKAIEYLDRRLEHLQLERESIKAAEKEFLKIKKLIPELKNEEKKQADQMFKVMSERFNSYDDVFEQYTRSIELTTQLYKLLQNEEADEKEVISLITKVNDSYERVFEVNETFNSKTEEYNRLREEFYQLIIKESSKD